MLAAVWFVDLGTPAILNAKGVDLIVRVAQECAGPGPLSLK